MQNKIPAYIKAAIRRRAAAAEKYFIADMQVSEYCKARGLDTEFVNGNVETVTRFDAEFFIRDIEESLERAKSAQGIKHKKGEDV